MDCRKGPETKIFHPGLVNLSSNFHKMAAFNWLPDFRSNAPSSFTYDLYGVDGVFSEMRIEKKGQVFTSGKFLASDQAQGLGRIFGRHYFARKP